MHSQSIPPSFICNQPADYEQKLQDLLAQPKPWNTTPEIPETSFHNIGKLFESNRRLVTAQNVDQLEQANKRLKASYNHPAAKRLFNETTQFIRTVRDGSASQAQTAAVSHATPPATPPATNTNSSSFSNGKRISEKRHTPSHQAPQNGSKSSVIHTSNILPNPFTSSSQPQLQPQPQPILHQSSTQVTTTTPLSTTVPTTTKAPSTQHTAVIQKRVSDQELLTHLVLFFGQEDRTWPNFKEFQGKCNQWGLSFADVARFIRDLSGDDRKTVLKVMNPVHGGDENGGYVRLRDNEEIYALRQYVLDHEKEVQSDADKQDILYHQKLACILIGLPCAPDEFVHIDFDREIRGRLYSLYHLPLAKTLEMETLAKLYRKYTGMPETHQGRSDQSQVSMEPKSASVSSSSDAPQIGPNKNLEALSQDVSQLSLYGTQKFKKRRQH
jgi:hypothetical protein